MGSIAKNSGIKSSEDILIHKFFNEFTNKPMSLYIALPLSSGLAAAVLVDLPGRLPRSVQPTEPSYHSSRLIFLENEIIIERETNRHRGKTREIESDFFF